MSVKNAIGTCLLIFGLGLAIIGWSKTSGETITKEINGKEVVLRNSDNYNLNWRAFFGLTFAGLGFLIALFPGDDVIDRGKYA
ncbi:MAG: hypothetical protein NWR72_11320 [Bacteroidia bacterium]|nr:hypothetical protein [Bacteroidia bacterium]